jgi:glutathionylspermidine synthase
MERCKIETRDNWRLKVEQLGFSYHSPDGVSYWDESAYYSFTSVQIEILEKVSNKLFRMCLKAVDHVIRKNLFERFHISATWIPLIKASWQRETPSIYGRFDLSWDGNPNIAPKLLEFNADTPTSLLEASVIQWFWLKEVFPEADQFNSMHEKLIVWFKQIRIYLKKGKLHFSSLNENAEDFMNMTYLQDCAIQAGIQTQFISVENIGWNGSGFTDLLEEPITAIFKLYPWEWIMHEEFGPLIPKTDTLWIEPPWKMILSNKAILPVLWELFPDHPNLLECYSGKDGGMKNYVKKPLLSREGANIRIVENGIVEAETGGEYGEEGFIYQKLHKLPEFNGNYPVIGSWIIGGKSAGIGIRESHSLITDNLSRFIPHRIT